MSVRRQAVSLRARLTSSPTSLISPRTSPNLRVEFAADFTDLCVEFGADFTDLCAEPAEFTADRADLCADFAEFAADLGAELAEFAADLGAKLARLGAELAQFAADLGAKLAHLATKLAECTFDPLEGVRVFDQKFAMAVEHLLLASVALGEIGQARLDDLLDHCVQHRDLLFHGGASREFVLTEPQRGKRA
jgi:hypothetical protein